MAALLLKILLALYIAFALLKFFDFFYLPYERRIEPIRAAYQPGNRTIQNYDNAVLILIVILVIFQFFAGMEYLSFTTGSLTGMTLIQVYFHRFSDVLPTEKAPDQPLSAIKLMSYSIQANPAKPWRELLLITLILVWSLAMIVTRGFGLFA